MTDTIVIGQGRYVRAALREDEYEAVFLQAWERLALGWSIAAWKPLLESRYGACRPDAAVVRRDLGAWAVVEVELSVHTGTHYRPQFEKLEAARYGPHLAGGMLNAFPGFPAELIRDLLRRQRPEMLCVADESSGDLLRACRDFGFQLAVLVPFRGLDGGFALHARRFPAEYERSPSPRVHVIAVSSEPWGGLYTARLPVQFPNLRDLQVRYCGEVSSMRVTHVGTDRRVFLPPEYVPSDTRAPTLTEIDPTVALFDLD